MRRFLGFAASIVVMSCFVSCGAREDSSNFASRNHPNGRGNGGNHGNHGDNQSEDTLPGQVNGSKDGRFPKSADHALTPGSLCEHASTYRYPEHIKYCERSVEPSIKAEIFVTYDKELGYETTRMQRAAFKIDHLIPLCMGGSNEVSNLWPQHVTIYENTDPIEPFLCDVLAHGRIKQSEAVKLILTIKETPFTAGEELRKLEAKY